METIRVTAPHWERARGIESARGNNKLFQMRQRKGSEKTENFIRKASYEFATDILRSLRRRKVRKTF